MVDPMVGEIRIMSSDVVPRGWAVCDGQVVPIIQNPALFSLLGSNFGGDGKSTFALPDLRGRTPVHVGNDLTLGQTGGEASHTLGPSEVPSHGHTAMASSFDANQVAPTGNILAVAADFLYRDPKRGGDLTTIDSSTVMPAGGESHENRQPFLTLTFCIALQGSFPTPG